MVNDKNVQKLVWEYLNEGKYVGMICAGETVSFYSPQVTSQLRHRVSGCIDLWAAKTADDFLSKCEDKAQQVYVPSALSVSETCQMIIQLFGKDFEYKEDPVMVLDRLVTRQVFPVVGWLEYSSPAPCVHSVVALVSQL